MTAIEERYTQQFLTMDRIVGEMNNTKDNLISSFEHLPFTRRIDAQLLHFIRPNFYSVERFEMSNFAAKICQSDQLRQVSAAVS